MPSGTSITSALAFCSSVRSAVAASSDSDGAPLLYGCLVSLLKA